MLVNIPVEFPVPAEMFVLCMNGTTKKRESLPAAVLFHKKKEVLGLLRNKELLCPAE